MTTLVVDTGQNLVGVFSVEEQLYVPYRGAEILIALQRIAEADEVVTYNGKDYDLKELGGFAGVTAFGEAALAPPSPCSSRTIRTSRIRTRGRMSWISI